MTSLIVTVVGLLVIAACNQLAPKVGVASPLILLALGIGVGFLPWVQAISVDPDIILEVVLPPLLCATASSMPVMDFRRELRSVAGLAIGLVAITAVVLGLVIHALVGAISLPWAIALGAVLSPTDAVAVTIVRNSGVNHRIITILEGEGLFNDATALVVLSSAVSAALMSDDASIKPFTLISDFAQALVVALIIGWLVGEIVVRVRGHINDSAADVVVSFTLPFLASIPVDYLGGSGLVAAVVAGLVVSYRGPRIIPPTNRRSASGNWKTIELILEGGIFLVMGLQAYGIVNDLLLKHSGSDLQKAVLVAIVAGGVTLLVRAAFVAPLLLLLARIRRHTQRRLNQQEERMQRFEERITHAGDVDEEMLAARNLSMQEWEQSLAGWRQRLERRRSQQRKARNDLEYFTSATLGPREGSIIVWAGMRGAVTLAAAQTLPLNTPMRSFILFVALLVASGSLVIQGLTLTPLVRLIKPQMAGEEDTQERLRLMRLLGNTIKDTALSQAIADYSQYSEQIPGGAPPLTRSFSTVGRALAVRRSSAKKAHAQAQAEPVAADTAAMSNDETATSDKEVTAQEAIKSLTQAKVRSLAVEAIHAQRDALLDARDEGVFSAQTLGNALERLDAEEILLSTHR